jgi:hypothetical protein
MATKGAKTAAFRAATEARLVEYGYSKAHYCWQPAPARLLVIVKGEFRVFEINSGVAASRREYEMGRLSAFAEMTGLKRRVEAKPKSPLHVEARQHDLIDMLASLSSSSGTSLMPQEVAHA